MQELYNQFDLSNNGKHDFENPTAYSGCLNMSAGIFKWVLKSNGKSLKRDKVVVRVIGTKYQREEIKQKAKEICYLLDKGQYKGPKSVNLNKFCKYI